MRKTIALCLALMLLFTTALCVGEGADDTSERERIEYALNLKNNPDQEWTYNASTDSWTLSIVTAVLYPVIENEEGVSVCVPSAYVVGIDTDGDGTADLLASDGASAKGSLVIDYDAAVTSANGQTYTAATAPVIINTGAAGYGNSSNTTASGIYTAKGYINVACGNRGKQDSFTDDNGNTVYTGDAPSCLSDQKAAIRFVKYNILLGNLPGSLDCWVSTGGSGGGAHAVMVAATGNNPDFYDYQIAVGAVGVYRQADGSYITSVLIDGEEVALSDAVWGCVAYSAITSLYEADMAMAFEYHLDTDYAFSTDFQVALADALSREYMDYINGQDLTADEAKVGFDLDGDGKLESVVPLTIEYDAELYAATNGYGGTYLTLYLAEFTENLQWYVDSLDYASGWTWFDTDGNALSDEAVAAMTVQDKAAAFIEGRYAKASADGRGGMAGGLPSGMGGKADFAGGNRPDGMKGDFGGTPPTGGFTGPDGQAPAGLGGDEMAVGTPDAGTTQSATGTTNSKNYASFDEMLTAYRQDIEEIESGDLYGNNLVTLYNPLHYIGAADTEAPAWTRIVCGAAEGDISMFNSLNLQLAWLSNGTDAVIEWQWDGGHVPSETLGNSLALYVDQMYGQYVAGAASIDQPDPEPQTVNGKATAMSGTDLSDWVSLDENGLVSFSLADAVRYRVNGASKAIPGFDVIDYGQEDYVFGSPTQDARHWSVWVLKALEENAETLAELFNP
ncbi:MAG: hypothetical protein IJ240_10865 [Clostridia bacterium]|nr:hypothetical protein [Clostridia bacterium]